MTKGSWKKSTDFPDNGDYVDDGFFEFMYEVSCELLEERFYLLPSEDQSVRVVCMPARLFEILRDNQAF